MVARLRGFTVAEVVLALALISVTVLTLLGLCLRTLQASRKTIDTGSGQMVLEQALEAVAQAAESSDAAAVWASNSATTPYSSDPVLLNDVTYLVSVYATDVVAASGLPFAADKRLKLLRATVEWRDLPQGRMGYGLLRASSTRLVHEP
jgi:Tfp pilus assembly protein PilV